MPVFDENEFDNDLREKRFCKIAVEMWNVEDDSKIRKNTWIKDEQTQC